MSQQLNDLWHTNKCLDKFGSLIDIAGPEITKHTIYFDQPTTELKATGARIVFLPSLEVATIEPLVWRLCLPAKPEKFHTLATEKAWRTIESEELCSAVTRNTRMGEYAGGIALRNKLGALGLSGFNEPDDHLVLINLMYYSGLLGNLNYPDKAETISYFSEIISLTETSGLAIDQIRSMLFMSIICEASGHYDASNH